jgi:rare lipoprotein A
LRTVALATVIGATALLSACSLTSKRAPPSSGPLTPPDMEHVPAPTTHPPPRIPDDLNSIPDAVPKFEPRSRRGNPPFYTVLGKRYQVLGSSDGYIERGVASWYGPTFHGESTSMGEKYDMYAMSAAHKTLPLPAYARVTNLSNGRSVVVRINDRGPFAKNRIIDLSYTAAAKLGMLREGTALVEVRTLSPGGDDSLRRADETPPQVLYVQAGAFSDEQNAKRLAERLRAAGISNAFVRAPLSEEPRVFRVRAGPVASTVEFDRLAARLAKLGVSDVRLATD